MHRHTITLTMANGAKLPIDLVLVRRNGDWLAAAQFNIGGNPVRVVGTASEAAVRAAMAKLGWSGASTGGLFDEIGKRIAKFARSKAVTNVLQSVSSFTKNPLFVQLAGIYPPLGEAVKWVNKGATAAIAAQSLIAKAKQGDANARQSITRIAAMAKTNSKAKMIHGVLAAVNQSIKDTALGDLGGAFSGAPLPPDKDLENLVRTVRAR